MLRRSFLVTGSNKCEIFVMPTAAIEHQCFSTKMSTPNELSKTIMHEPNAVVAAAWILSASRGQAARARTITKELSGGRLKSVADTVDVLKAMYLGTDQHDEQSREVLGRTTWTMQELLNIVTDDPDHRIKLPSGWPSG